MDEREVGRLLQAGRLAAFRGRPAAGIEPLGRLLRAADPTSTVAGEGRWLAAVCAAALGRYGAALDHLDALPGQGVRAALGAATRGAVHRQLGRHAQGEAADLAGLDLLATDRGSSVERAAARGRLGAPVGSGGGAGVRRERLGAAAGRDGGRRCGLRTDARTDCLIGLVADAVGQGQVEEATARLARAAAAAKTARDPRHVIRMGWVRAEVALLTGDPHRAVTSAAASLAAARRAGYPRHVTKGLLFLGVATTEIGDPGGLDLLRESAATATDLGLLPLAWPAHAVLAARTGSTAHRSAAAQAVKEIGAALPADLLTGWYAAADRAALL